jgi:hypothetical protein
MDGRPTKLLATGATIALVWVATAAAQPRATGTHFEGKAGKAVFSIDVVRGGSGGQVSKVTNLVWDGLKCGSDVFTGGISKPIKVKRNRFSSTQPVNGVSVKLTVMVKGTFTHNSAAAAGTLSIKGVCTTPTTHWHVVSR